MINYIRNIRYKKSLSRSEVALLHILVDGIEYIGAIPGNNRVPITLPSSTTGYTFGLDPNICSAAPKKSRCRRLIPE